MELLSDSDDELNAMDSMRDEVINSNAKPIQVGISSVLELKAILAQKESVLKGKQAHSSFVSNTSRIANVQKQTQNKGIQDRMQKDQVKELDESELGKLERSYEALKRKELLYDQMKNNQTDNEELLVDFLMKYDVEDDEPVKKKTKKIAIVKANWVEETDEFGRTRLVKEEEAIKLKSDFVPAGQSSNTNSNSSEPGLMSSDMKRELERQQWEKEELGQAAPKRGIHFDSNWEKRSLGTGFFQFSQNEAERKAQFEELNSLRTETIQSRSRLQDAKERRQDRLKDRKALLAERARKRKANMDNSVQSTPEVEAFLSTIT
ncbi:hypothetical protein BC833DRAFT_611689 [Globomyces pollinis-pini]|nr:hypothetical protein BC833DRAFT_611689 [Globomyces pollinis-pini]